jgi:hypothetical protein
MTTDTYSYSCRCGTKSPRFSSRKARSEWHADHVREGCPARRAKPRHRHLSWDEMDEILADAKKLKPIAPELNYASARNTPRDSSLVGSWGVRRGTATARPGWTQTACERASPRCCSATLRRCPTRRRCSGHTATAGARNTTSGCRPPSVSGSRRFRRAPARPSAESGGSPASPPVRSITRS